MLSAVLNSETAINVSIKIMNSFVEMRRFMASNAMLFERIINAQYPKLEVKMTNAFHDRFMVLDDKTVYHIGALIKDAGKKCFGITLIQDDTMANDLISRLKKIK